MYNKQDKINKNHYWHVCQYRSKYSDDILYIRNNDVLYFGPYTTDIHTKINYCPYCGRSKTEISCTT